MVDLDTICEITDPCPVGVIVGVRYDYNLVASIYQFLFITVSPVAEDNLMSTSCYESYKTTYRRELIDMALHTTRLRIEEVRDHPVGSFSTRTQRKNTNCAVVKGPTQYCTALSRGYASRALIQDLLAIWQCSSPHT